MSVRASLSGNEAVAIAMRQINPDVIAAFPITPSTEVPQYFSTYVSQKLVDTELVLVESEHSAISACVGASAAGGRVMTATSSQGLALMHEILYIAASDRLPITMAVVNRTLSGPISIHNDHSDSIGSSYSGWLQIYAANVQEAYDNFIQCVRIAEDKRVLLPVMVCYDGFITSHAVENLFMEDDELVKKFVGKYAPEYPLLGKRPVAVGSLDMQPQFFEHKRLQAQGMMNALDVIAEVAAEYEKETGRKQFPFFEEYKMEDAEVAMVIMGSSADTAKAAVDLMRAKGVKAGALKLRAFRPFPAAQLAKALEGKKAVAVMDKVDAFAADGGPVFHEVRSALFDDRDRKPVLSFIYGLGGRDVTPESLCEGFERTAAEMGKAEYSVYNYLGVRE